MIVAISQRDVKHKHGNRDCLEQSYTTYLEDFGISLIPISNKTTNLLLKNNIPISKIILSGGNNISPEFYGRVNNEIKDCSLPRDNLESNLISIAIQKRIPLLGICRGMQFMNVYFGGSITDGLSENHVAKNHNVEVVDQEARNYLGTTIEVNSYHDQGILLENLSQELGVFATSKDGVIEGIYHTQLPIAGIQWHPERPSPDEDTNKKILEAFLKNKLYWK